MIAISDLVITGGVLAVQARQPQNFKRYNHSEVVINLHFLHRVMIYFIYLPVEISVGFVEQMHEQSVALSPLSTMRLLRLVNNLINGAFRETWRHISFTGPLGSSYRK
jgi:hypothetical protein